MTISKTLVGMILTTACSTFFSAQSEAKCLRYGDVVSVDFLYPTNTLSTNSGNHGMYFYDKWGTVGHSGVGKKTEITIRNTSGKMPFAHVMGAESISLFSDNSGPIRGARRGPSGYLKGEPNGHVYGNANIVNSWERWSIHDPVSLQKASGCIKPDTPYSLKSHHGKWLYAGHRGSTPTDGHVRSDSQHFGNAARIKFNWLNKQDKYSHRKTCHPQVFEASQVLPAGSSQIAINSAKTNVAAAWRTKVRNQLGAQWDSGYATTAHPNHSIAYGYFDTDRAQGVRFHNAVHSIPVYFSAFPCLDD